MGTLRQQWEGLEDLLLGFLASLLSLVSRLLGATFRRLLGGALRAVDALQYIFSFFVPGSFVLAHTVANRVRQLLEDSAALALEQGPESQEPLDRRLAGCPPPVAACLRDALSGLPRGAEDFKLTHLKLSGHIRFSLPRSGSSRSGGSSAGSGDANSWRRLQADVYLSPAPPGYVLSATIQLGPLSFVRGFSSFLRGLGASQWKLYSPFRSQDMQEQGAGILGRAPLAAFLAEAPCCPTALLPSQALQWRALTDQSAEATVREGGAQASAVYHFDRLNRIVQAAVATSTHAASPSAAATSPLLPAGSGRRRAPSVSWYYRQHRRVSGMLVPTEVEACWGGAQGEDAGSDGAFLHCDLTALNSWTSHEMAGGAGSGPSAAADAGVAVAASAHASMTL